MTTTVTVGNPLRQVPLLALGSAPAPIPPSSLAAGPVRFLELDASGSEGDTVRLEWTAADESHRRNTGAVMAMSLVIAGLPRPAVLQDGVLRPAVDADTPFAFSDAEKALLQELQGLLGSMFDPSKGPVPVEIHDTSDDEGFLTTVAEGVGAGAGLGALIGGGAGFVTGGPVGLVAGAKAGLAIGTGVGLVVGVIAALDNT